MREKLIAFIKAIQDDVTGEGHAENRELIRVSGSSRFPSLDFGYEYFPASKVLFWKSDTEYEELSVEDAVDRFLPNR